MTSESIVRNHLAGILLALSLVIAVAAYLIFPPHWVARTLFFPGATGSTLSGERRLVPRSRDREHELSLVAESLILGPALISHSRTFSPETKIRSLILDGRTVYVDLSESAMIENSEVHISTKVALTALEDTLKMNFRYLENVIVTIDGDVPFAPGYRSIGR